MAHLQQIALEQSARAAAHGSGHRARRRIQHPARRCRRRRRSLHRARSQLCRYLPDRDRRSRRQARAHRQHRQRVHLPRRLVVDFDPSGEILTSGLAGASRSTEPTPRRAPTSPPRGVCPRATSPRPPSPRHQGSRSQTNHRRRAIRHCRQGWRCERLHQPLPRRGAQLRAQPGDQPRQPQCGRQRLRAGRSRG